MRNVSKMFLKILRKFFNANLNWNLIVLLILLINMMLNIALYYNTNTFDVSEAKAGYMHLQQIQSGEKLPLFINAYRTTLAYIASGFIRAFGSIDFFFWFQALVATLAVYLLYKVIYLITKSRFASILGLCLATIYLDYHLLVPVLYDQIFEVFFTILIIYISILLTKSKKLFYTVMLIALIVTTFYVSLLFRGTLRYFLFVEFLLGVACLFKRDWKTSAKLFLTFVLMFAALKLFPLSNYSLKNRVTPNNFRFFGHTLYGGDGGEGAFIYERNQLLYENKLKAYLKDNKIDSVNTKVINRFQMHEINQFIRTHPDKWFLLQIRKIVYTFGIVPIKDSLTLLSKGKLNIGFFPSIVLIQIPFVIIMLLFISLVSLGFRLKDLLKTDKLFLYITFIYLIGATCLYGHYQERYRIVVIMAVMIPFICIYGVEFWKNFQNQAISKTRYAVSLILVLAVLLFWGLQSYNALVLNASRFLS